MLLIIMLLSSLLGHATDGKYWAMIVLIYGPILLVTIIIHEFGHALMTMYCDGQVKEMVLWPLGGYVICGPVDTVTQDFCVAIAGPLTHLPQMALWGFIFAVIENGVSNLEQYYDENMSFGGNLCSQAFFLNVILLVFNLFVPAYPLDGGRCLAAGLMVCGLDGLKAAIATAIIGMVISIAFVIWGLVSFIQGSPGGLFTAIIGAWILMESWKLLKLTRPASGQYGEIVDNLKNHPIFGQRCYQNEIAKNSNNNSNGAESPALKKNGNGFSVL